MRNFNEIFRKDVPYDNFKSHKKPGFHPLFRRYNFQKTSGGIKLTPTPFLPSRFRVKYFHKFNRFLRHLEYCVHEQNFLETRLLRISFRLKYFGAYQSILYVDRRQIFFFKTLMTLLQCKQETLRVVTITIIFSTLALLWKFQYFRRPIYYTVKHLW